MEQERLVSLPELKFCLDSMSKGFINIRFLGFLSVVDNLVFLELHNLFSSPFI